MNNRSFHFIPANKSHLFNKIDTLKADHIVFDLEDAVPENEKKLSLNNLDILFSKKIRNNFWIRCNDINSLYFENDIRLINKYTNLGVVIPKFNNTLKLERTPIMNGRKIILLLEDFSSLANVCNLSISPYGIGLGLEDMLAAITLPNDKITKLVEHIKLQFICNVKCLNTIAIDGISSNYNNKKELLNECENSRAIGFDAKFSIHPFQLEPINEAFNIADEDIKWAKHIYEITGFNASFGYTKINNEVITPPKILKAKNILKEK